MNAKLIRGWLLRQPRPAQLRLQLPDGSSSEVELGGQSFVSVAESVSALAPEVVEALDGKGKLIRAMRPAELAGDGSEASPVASASASASGAIGNDPETQRLTLVARLIADAYRHSTDVAFQRMVDLFQAINDRADSTDRAREAMYRAQVRQLEEQIRNLGAEPEEQGDLLSQMLGAFMGGASSPPVVAKPTNGAHANGASNGAAKAAAPKA